MMPPRSLLPLLAGAFSAGLLSLLASGATPLRAQTAAPSATPAPSAGPTLPVVVSPAARGPVPLEITVNGNVVAEATVSVRSRVDGQIEKQHVEEGQRVERGQLLFTIDSRMTQALLAQQEAQLARDRAQAVRARSDANRYASLRGEGF